MIDFPNGSGNRIAVATPAGLDEIEGTSTCSWMGWLRYDSSSGNYNSIMSRQVISALPYWENVGFWVRSDGKLGCGMTVGASGDEIAADAGSTSTGTLYFLAAVYDNGATPKLSVYLDGASLTTSSAYSGTIYATDKSFCIGANCNNNDGTTFDEWFDGQFGPFFVSKYALTLDALEAIRLGRGQVLPPGFVFGAQMFAPEGVTFSGLNTISGEAFSITGSPTGYGSPHRGLQPMIVCC